MKRIISVAVISLFSTLNSCGKKSSSSTSLPTVTLKGAGSTSTNLLGSGTIDASVMKFKVYKFAVSATTDCASPITIFSDSAGVEKDMLTGPTFGSGSLAAGTYPCVMIEISKIITDAPATSSLGCVASTTQSDVICNESNGQKSQYIDGTAVTCSGGSANDQHVTLYITTISAGSSGTRSLLPPTSTTDTASGLKLTSAFVVSGDASGTFTVNYKNFFSASSSACGSNAPTFGFQ